MSWKEFLKPDLRKVILTLIISFIVAFFGCESLLWYYESFRGIPGTGRSCGIIDRVFIYLVFIFPIKTVLVDPGGRIAEINYLIFTWIFWYLISCFIIWAYDAYSKKKKKK